MSFYLYMLLFRVVLDVSYVLFVHPLYSYSGFSLDFSLDNYLLSLGCYVATLFALRTTIKSISDYFFTTFVLFVIAPISSIYAIANFSFEPVLVVVASYFLFVFIVRSRLVRFPHIPVIAGGDRIALIVSCVMVAFIVSWYFYSGAKLNFDPAKVYDFREDNAELAASGIFAYLNNWTYKIFSIFLISYFLHKKKWLFAFLCIAIQVMFYGFSAHKSVLFGVFLVLGIWFWFSRSNKAYVLPLGLMIIVLVSLFFYFVFDYALIGSMLIRRVFYVPAYLTYQYFDFFGNNEFVYWSNSILSGYVNYPYDANISKVIGEYEGSGANANNGFISMGYAHFGYVGVLIYTIVFALIIRFFDIVTEKVGTLWLSLAISAVPLRAALISSDLLTTLLTHGLALIILLILLIRKNARYEY